MNRTLKRPMFRIGGSAGTGITSGLDQPRKQYAKGSGYMDDKIKEIQMAFERYQMIGGTAPFEVFAKEFATENFNSGGRAGYQQGSMPTFQASGVPGFLTNFGLNLLATPPQGNIFQTAGVAARDPFNQLQISQARAREQQGERDFLRGERIAGDKSAMDRLKTKIASDEKIAGNKTNDALYNVMLEQYIEDDLPPQVAERAAAFSVKTADELRSAVTGSKYGGVLTFDIRDPNNQKQVRKNLDGKVVYDPYEDNYKYIVVKDGEVYFDEFNSIGEIKFPEITLDQDKKRIQNFESDIFSPRVEDAQP
jgi:hypothetical protein